VTIVLVRDDLLGLKKPKYTPTIFDWKKMVETDSCLNTPPCHRYYPFLFISFFFLLKYSYFSIYMAGLCFEWLLELGGLSAIGAINQRKAEKLYNFIDDNPFYTCPVKEKRFRYLPPLKTCSFFF